MDTPTIENDTLISLTADIVSAHVSHNAVSTEDVPKLIENVFGALRGAGDGQAETEDLVPAVPVRSSVKKNYIVCLECGKRMKMLKRHLSTEHGLSPEEYKERWNLSADYPLVAPNYAQTRRDLAMKIGLGRKPAQRRGRKKKG
jgi:predicted transcriptional regulator